MKSFFRKVKQRSRNIRQGFRPLPDSTSGIITGEKIQLLCDHFIGRKYDFHYNPIIRKVKDRWVLLENLNAPFNNQPLAFCYTYLLKELGLLIKKLKWFENPFLLVFHNSDKRFKKEHIKLFEALPQLQKIFSQNAEVQHEKVTPIPLGIANSMWPHGNLSAIQNILNKEELNKDKLVYFNFSIQTNQEKREECFQIISKKGMVFLPKMNYENYMESLSSYKYAICPEGNGTDTHRFWESLYLKVVPICKKNPVSEFFAKDFPVILLDDWEDLQLSQLDLRYDEFKWQNLHKLEMEYYQNLISL